MRYRDRYASAESRAAANVFIHKRDNFGSLGKPLEKRALPLDEAALVTEFDYARGRLAEERVIPVISVFLDLWPGTSMPRRAEAEQAVAQAIKRLEPIRAYLAAAAGGKLTGTKVVIAPKPKAAATRTD